MTPTLRDFRLGLGCMGMSDVYGPADESESIATIHAALDAGVTLIDTGDFYGMGHNELLIGRRAATAAPRATSVLSVKFGALRDPAARWLGVDARPAAVKNFLAYTLRGSGPTTSTSTARRGSTRRCRSRRRSARSPRWSRPGTCAHVGLSEVGAETLRRAARRAPRSPTCRSSTRSSPAGSRRSVLPTCRELGIGDHRLRRPLAGAAQRPLVGGRRPAPATSAAARHASSGENLERNLALVERLRAVAERAGRRSPRWRSPGCSRRGDDIVPLVGARRRERLAEALGALELELRRTIWRRSRRPCRPVGGRRALQRAADGAARQRARLTAHAGAGADCGSWRWRDSTSAAAATAIRTAP